MIDFATIFVWLIFGSATLLVVLLLGIAITRWIPRLKDDYQNYMVIDDGD